MKLVFFLAFIVSAIVTFLLASVALTHNPLNEFYTESGPTSDFFVLLAITFGLSFGSILILFAPLAYFLSRSRVQSKVSRH